MLGYFSNILSSYKQQYGIPENLYSRLSVFNELDTFFKVFAEYNWELPIKETFWEINRTILRSYKALDIFIDEIKLIGIDDQFSVDDYNVILHKAHIKLFVTIKASITKFKNNMNQLKIKNYSEILKNETDEFIELIYERKEVNMPLLYSNSFNEKLFNLIKKLNEILKVANEFSALIIELKKLNNVKLLQHKMHGVVLLIEIDGEKFALKKNKFSPYGTVGNDIVFSSLDSPYICTIYKIFQQKIKISNEEYETSYWSLMEYLDVNIAVFFNKVDENTIENMFRDLLNCVLYLHKNNIAYNGMFSGNIHGKTTEDGKIRYKLIDFDFAQILDGCNKEYILKSFQKDINYIYRSLCMFKDSNITYSSIFDDFFATLKEMSSNDDDPTDKINKLLRLQFFK